MALPFVDNIKEFFAPEPDKVRARDVVRAVPGSTVDVGVDIFQGTMRGLDSLGRSILNRSVTDTRTPGTGFERAIFGDTPFSLTSEGADLTSLIGVDPNSRGAQILNPIVGAGFTLIDAVPGGRAVRQSTINSAESFIKTLKSLSDETVETLSKTNDPQTIKSVLFQNTGLRDSSFKAINQSADEIVSTLAKETDPSAVRNIVREQQEAYSKHLQSKVQEYKQMSDEQFAKRHADLKKQQAQIADLPVQRRINNTIRPRETQQVNPYQVLKQRIADMSKATKDGARAGRREVQELQTQLVNQIKKDIPLSVRGKFISQIKNANTPAKLDNALERVDKEAAEIAQAVELARQTGKKRQKIAFINKMNDFSALVARDIKETIGIDKPIRQMSGEEIDKYFEELVKRVQFRSGRASKVARETKDKLDLDDYATAHFYVEKPGRMETFRRTKDSMLKTADNFAGVLSERLRKISPEILSQVRRMEFNIKTRQKEDFDAIQPIVKELVTLRKKDPQTYAAVDLMLKNGEVDSAIELAPHMESAIKRARTTLDDIHKRAKETNSDIGYLEGYFPRKVRKEMVDDFLDEINNTPISGPVQKAISDRANKIGRELTADEKAAVVNSMIRGYRPSSISLASPKSFEKRAFDYLPPELNRYYENVVETLPQYVRSVNENIEARRLFGKVDKNFIDGDFDLQDTIGGYTARLVDDGKITNSQARELQEIMTARFNQGQMDNWVGGLKNFGYVFTMGQPTNAITQIGDLGSSIYKAGTTKTLKAFFSKKNITAQDLGITQMAKEFTQADGKKFNTGKLVNNVFALTGLSKVDFLGKNTLINASWQKAIRGAKTRNRDTVKDVQQYFGPRAEEVLEKFSRGVQDEDAKFYLFNVLSDFQPITDMEVPAKYLTSQNGKIFYMLQTWAIKALNVYRREVVEEMRQSTSVGGYATAFGNLVKLTTALTLAGATANEIKDFIRGKDVPFSENAVTSLIQISGVFNRYSIEKGAREGTLAGEAFPVPPQVSLIDNTLSDLSKAWIAFSDADKNLEINELRTTRNVPFGGDLYYWWFGKGVDRKDEEPQSGITSRPRSAGNNRRVQTRSRTTVSQ